MEQLFSQFADIRALNAQKEEILKIFTEIKQSILSLSNAGFKFDGAKNIKQATDALKQFDEAQARIASKLPAAFGMSKGLATDIEALKKAKGITNEYIDSLVKLAQAKQVNSKGQQREKPMSGYNLYMGENMKGGKTHNDVAADWKALDADMKALWNYAAQFTKFGAAVESANAPLQEAADNVHQHAAEAQKGSEQVDRWTQAIEKQKAAVTELLSSIGKGQGLSALSDDISENIGRQVALKDQLSQVKASIKELNGLNTGELAGAFTDDIIKLTEAEERLKLEISQTTRFIKNQTKEMLAEEGSLDQLRAKLNQMLQTFDGMSEVGQKSEAGQLLQRQITEITAAIKEGEQGTDRYFRSVGKYAEVLKPLFEKLGDQIQKLKQEQKELQEQGGVTDLTGQQPKGRVVVEGFSVNRLAEVNAQLQTLEGLQQAAAKSSGSYAQQVRVLDSALEEMARNGGQSVGFVLEMQDALQDAKIQNLGSFEGSAKIIVEAFEEARVKVRQLSETVGEQAPQTQAARQEYEALSRIVENPQFLNVAGKVGDATAEIRYFTKALDDLEDQGQKNSATYKQLQARLAELTDRMGDTRAEIRAMSSDTRSIDLVASGLNTLVSTYQTYIGVVAMAGANEEELQASMQKLLAVQNVANGMREIANELTTRGTLANKGYALVQGLVATALDRTATAGKRAQAALGLLGIAATVVGAIVVAYQMLNKTVSDYAKRQQQLNDVLKDSGSEYARAVKEVNELRINIDLAKKGMIDKKEVVQQYNETMGKTTGEVKSLEEAEAALARNADAYIQFTLKKAAANIALGKSAQKAFEMEEIKTKAPTEFLSWWDKINLPDANAPSFMEQATKKAAPAIKKQGEELKKEGEAYNDIAKQFLADAATIAKQFGFDFDGKKDKGDTKKPKDAGGDMLKNAEATRKALFDVRQRQIQDEIAGYDALAKDEKQSYQTRLLAAASLYEARQRLASEQKDFGLEELRIREQQEVDQAKKEITNREQREKLLATITKKYAAERQNILSTYNSQIVKDQADTTAQIEELQKGQTDKLREDREKAAQTEYDRIVTNLDNQLKGIQEAADKELEVEIDKFKRGEITKEQYEQRKLEIENKARAASLQAEIDYQKALINISNLPEDKRQEALKKLYDLEEQLRQANLKSEEAAANRKWELTEEFYDKLKELGAELKDMTLSLLTGGVDREKERLQEQIDMLDKKSQKEIEAIQQTETNEQKKAESIRKIEARAAAQKEVLEHRQRQLDLQKARYERAAQISSIIGNTARGIAEALPDIPLSIVVGAIGAAQLVKVLATPLPGYYTGVDSAPEGYAQVAERGRELAVDPSGKLVMYERPAITYLKEGTRIYNNQETEQILREGAAAVTPVGSIVPFKGQVEAGRPAPQDVRRVPAEAISVGQVVPDPVEVERPGKEKGEQLFPLLKLQAFTQHISKITKTAALKHMDAPVITVAEMQRDMQRLQELRYQQIIRIHDAGQSSSMAAVVQELERLGEQLEKIKKLNKELVQKSRIVIHNEVGVESKAYYMQEAERYLNQMKR